VLDASALLALLNEEPGNEVVAESIPGAVISAVNLSEVAAKLVEAGMPDDAVRSALGDLGIEIRAFDSEAAYLTGALRAQTRKLGLSLGDRACVALGLQLSFPVLTADRNWKELDLGIEVRVIR
jgi:ribonuclease VapC